MRSQLKYGFALFIFVSSLNILLTSGNIRSADYVVAYSIAGNLIEKGSFEATPIENFETWAVRTGTDGKQYCRYGIGHSLLGVPAYLACIGLERVWQGKTHIFDSTLVRFYSASNKKQVLCGFTGSLINGVVLGLLGVMIFALSLKLGLSRLQGISTGILATIFSPLFYLSSDFTAEPASTLVLALSLIGMLHLEQKIHDAKTHKFVSFLTGFFLGISMLFKIAHIILILPAIMAFFLIIYPIRNYSRKFFLLLISFLSGFLLNVFIVAFYNYIRFGSILETGYGGYVLEFTNPLLEGIAGQLFSPGRGLFIYFPVTFLGLLGSVILWKTSRSLCVCTLGMLFSLLLFYSTWFSWEGGWTYGPRLLSPVASLLSIPAVMIISSAKRIATKIAVIIPVSFSGLLSILGFAVDYIDYGFYIWKLYGDGSINAMRWSLLDAPIIAYWTFPARRHFLIENIFDKDVPISLIFFFAITLIAMIWSAVSIFLLNSTNTTKINN